MIKIVFHPKDYEVRISGHAGGEKGKDIVCASVSTLFYTLAKCLIESSDMLKEYPVIKDKENDEFKIISCIPKEEYENNIVRSYWTILVGMEEISLFYPEKVQFLVET